MSADRAVSTVMDVAMALLLISASILLIGIHLHDSDDEFDENRADRTAELLGESTISVRYSLEDAAPIADRQGEYHRTEYGSATGLLADAAVANVHVDGTRIRPTGDEFETAVGASVESALIGSNRDFYVVAEWEPYDDAAINGTATAGERPPPNEDVSSVTLTASSGIPAIDSDEIETAYLNADTYWNDYLGDRTDLVESPENASFEAAGTVIGSAIVDGYFPPAATQRSLESQGLSHELTVSHYEQMVKPLEYEFTGTTAPAHHGPLKRDEADAVEANAQVVRGIADADAFGRNGLGQWIGEDLQTALADEIAAIDEAYDGRQRDEEIAALLADEVSTDEVTITIQTWNA
ncbi:hypothetical protein HYG81_06500 [Natrinema zhouii]|nr:hypothetical protein [Natrinema zhouii]QLK27823.2 hypothetical protein HYG81_06500 [Natrinema zhouii]